jgi:cellulose 1,4-beta-cellobiosidase
MKLAVPRVRLGVRRRLRRSVALLASVTLVGGSLALAAVAAPSAANAQAASCSAAYSVTTDWGTGFTAAITVTDNGTAAITGWTLTYSYSGNQTLTDGWSGNWSQSGEAITVTNESWNGSLAAGASTSIGANFSYTGTNTAPTSVTCTASGGSSGGGGAITASTSSLSVNQGSTGTFTLALSSAPAASLTVSIAASGNTGLTDSPTSLTFTPSNFATAQTVTVTANSSGTGTTTFTASASGYTSAVVNVTENAVTTGTPSIDVTPTSQNITQGSTGTVGISLSSAPSSNVTVSIAASGNTGLTDSPTSLTFTPSNFSTAQNVTITANSSGTGATTFTASASGLTSVTFTATEVASSSGGGSCGSGITLQANPPSFSVPQGGTEVFGLSLSASPSAAITVTVTQTGNTGLSISSGASTTLSSSDWNLPQPVYVVANSSGTGAATFTVSATGCTSVTVQGTETAASTGTVASHVVNPFTGANWYVNPDYTAEVATSAAAASGTLAAQMTYVGNEPTFIWLDHIGAIYGGSDNMSGAGGTARMSLAAQLQNAAANATSPTIFPIVIYDLPDRDCDALASNGELSISNNGLSYYEHSYIDPIAQILSNYENTNLRVVAVIEPDSLPNLVTNSSVTNCADANSSGVYVDGIEYALNKLHAIPNVYNYMDIAHSAWLGWPSNMTPAVSLYKQVASATTDGVDSVDGFISDTANTIPVVEPYMTATESVDGNPVDSVLYYSYDPYIEELTYDEAMYSNLVSAGFPSTVGMLIDTSRDGWGDPSLRPTGACSTSTCTTTTEFVNDSKIDERPFRGDWCNPENAGIGALPQANPLPSTFANLYAYVWVKPPGESDGTYPAYSGTGDPHCDPNGTQTDGSGNTYPTDAIPDSPPAGHWFPVEFTQLVQDAYPAIP